MGTRKSAMELWRNREMSVARSTLYKLRHSPEKNQNQFLENLKPGSRAYSSVQSSTFREVMRGRNETSLLHRGYQGCTIHSGWPSTQLTRDYGANPMTQNFVRSISSQASKESGKSSQTKKEISNVEDPFDAPTYNIPEKPVTFTEGASYSLIILAGLGIAAIAGYGVFKELIFEPKEYKIFGKALKRIQDDAEVRVRIGHPITGYGQDVRNRAARQRIPNRTWTDEDGVEHIEVNFHIRGPHGAGKVFSEMYKDSVDRQWKYTYLIVEIKSPSPAQLILESYLPSYAPSA